jgi:hypothetical protein
MRPQFSQVASWFGPNGPLPRAAVSTSLEIFKWQPLQLPPCDETTTGCVRTAMRS